MMIRNLPITFSVQKMFGTFYRNDPPEKPFPNILKCFNRIAKPKYLLHGVSGRCCFLCRLPIEKTRHQIFQIANENLKYVRILLIIVVCQLFGFDDRE